MNIQPGFTRHWKVKSLARDLGDPLAPVYLINLWGHCQSSRAWVFDIPIAGLAEVCEYQGDPPELDRALRDGGWIDRSGETVTVIGWDEYNAGLIARWKNGARGGRPKKPIGSRPVSTHEPAANRKKTNIIQGDGMGLDETQSSARFEAWWKSYPARHGRSRGNKSEARTEWDKLTDPQRDMVEIATTHLAAAVSRNEALPKDAQRFLRSPNKQAGADPSYLEWVEVPTVTRQNDAASMDNGTMDRVMGNRIA